ncbi:MAG: ParB-like nuclease domain-containing protein [Clostridiales bacterium]|nr:ParB-like nuclease domain-containing protein [Clostridiales bacterium]
MSKFTSPVYNVKKIPIEKIHANRYNPNSVAKPEMDLLYQSIKIDGYTMPIVCDYDSETDSYEIVDGFHRYMTMKNHKDIFEREGGCLPVVVTYNTDIHDKMASTIRHNRARGTHNIELMSKIVAELTESGMSDLWISKNIGMDLDEILRLKQITGLAALFKNEDFSKSWE